MAVPLLTTDYFSKPDAEGSISGTVARMMATAGAALSERVEKYSSLAEAKLKAPAVTAAYGQAYSKIASGDYSGFTDMAQAMQLTAGNPLLTSMAKEANDLGIHLANNYTQQAVLTDRISTQEKLQKERLASQASLQDDRQFETEALRVDSENQKIRERNQQRIAARDDEARIRGVSPDQVQMEPLEKEQPTPSRVRRVATTGGSIPSTANPTGLPVVEPDLPTNEDPLNAPAASGTPAPSSAPVAAPSATPSFVNSDDRIGKIMNDNGLAVSDMAGWKEENGQVTFPNGKTLNPDDSAYFMSVKDKISGQQEQPLVNESMTKKEAGEAVKVGETPSSEVLQFGEIQIQVGKGKAGEEGMKLKSQTVKTPGGSKTFEDPNFADKKGGDKEARDKFIESVGMMNSDPKAINFILSNWRDKSPKVGFEEVKNDKSKVVAIRMYGIGEDGKRVAYDNGADASAPYKDEVSPDFYKSYKEMLSVKDRVNDKYGIKLEGTATTAKTNTVSTGSPDLDKAMSSEIAALKQKYGNNPVPAEEVNAAKRRVKALRDKAEEQKLADDKYSLGPDLEAEKEKKDHSAKAIADYRRQVADIEKKLDSGEETVYPIAQGPGSAPMPFVNKLNSKKRNELVVLRSNLLKKIRELE